MGSMSRNDQFLRLALDVARESTHPKWKLGAVLARGARVVASAPNIQKNDPFILEGGPGTSVHAEVNALRKMFRQADRAAGTTLYVARVSRGGEPRLARPCLGCYHQLLNAEVRSICYTLNSSGYGIETMTHPTYKLK